MPANTEAGRKVKRSNTVEKLANLLAEKRRRRESLRLKGDMRREESTRRKKEHDNILNTATTQDEDKFLNYKNGSNTSDTDILGELPGLGYMPNVKALPPQAQKQMHRQRHDVATAAAAAMGPPKSKPKSKPTPKIKPLSDNPDSARRGSDIPKVVRGLSRGVSRGFSSTALLAGRSISKAAELVHENQHHMLNNADMRRRHLQNLQELAILRSAQKLSEEGRNKAQSVPDKASNKSADAQNKELRRQAEKDRKMRKQAKEKDVKRKENIKKIEEQLEKRMEGHVPWFARFITVLQGVIIIAMCFDGELAGWGMGIETSVVSVELLEGTTLQTVQQPENPYFGPKVETLLKWGSKWAPCMRSDSVVDDLVADMLALESDFGCCVSGSGNCGMMGPGNCASVGTYAGAGVTCESLGGSCSAIKLRPCCISVLGQCAVISQDHCNALGGLFQEDAELCQDTPCLDKSCGLYSFAKDNYESPNQFYRFVTAIFLHVGIIHYVMNALGQYVMVGQVEFVAGFWRTAAMYVSSGALGFMISALFSADTLSNGASAAIYGMLGVETVDMFQTWQLLQNPYRQLIGLMFKLVLFLGIGTLPYIDNFAHVGGFFAGIVSGIVFLPYLVFGTADGMRKKLLQIVCTLCLFALVIGLLHKFYTDREITCSWCHYVNCVPYTPTSCENT